MVAGWTLNVTRPNNQVFSGADQAGSEGLQEPTHDSEGLGIRMNLTPKRIALLRLLGTRQCYRISSLADEIAPRQTHSGTGWSPQGAARWGGGYVRPLADAGLVAVNRIKGQVSITEKGRQVLAELDAKNPSFKD